MPEPLVPFPTGVHVDDDDWPYNIAVGEGVIGQQGPWRHSFDKETQTDLYERTVWKLKLPIPPHNEFTYPSFGGEQAFRRQIPWYTGWDNTLLTPEQLMKFAIPLIDISGPTPVLDGSIHEYVETYARVPDNRIEPVAFVDEEQQVEELDGKPTLVRRSMPKTGFDFLDYWFTDDPTAIEIVPAGRYTATRGYIFGTGVNVQDTLKVAETSEVTRWNGLIWQRRTRFVPVSDPLPPYVIATP